MDEIDHKKIRKLEQKSGIVLNFADCAERLRKGEPFDDPEEQECVEVIKVDGVQKLRGPAVCVECGHEWEHTSDIGPNSHTCPVCHLERAVWKTFVYAEVGAYRRLCPLCHCELFTIYGDTNNKTKIRCSGCGQCTDLEEDNKLFREEVEAGNIPPPPDKTS